MGPLKTNYYLHKPPPSRSVLSDSLPPLQLASKWSITINEFLSSLSFSLSIGIMISSIRQGASRRILEGE
ncbi:hypothetical protein SK128_007799, partial [Halocaridina rubra]